MPRLTHKEINTLLATPVIARLAVVKPNGAPYIIPVWQYWNNESIYIIPRAKSMFVEYIRKEPRVAVSCADDITSNRILIEGFAKIIEGPVLMFGKMLDIAREMAQRYGGRSGIKYLESTIDKPRYLVKIVPQKMITWTGDWHPRYN